MPRKHFNILFSFKENEKEEQEFPTFSISLLEAEMKKSKHVFWESLLIISTVFVFRSLWLLMDEVDFLSLPFILGVFFVLGMVLMGISFYRLTHAD